jgi:hypothetical protein
VPKLAVNSVTRPKAYRRYFTGILERPRDGRTLFQFTLKYKTPSFEGWKWANEDSNLTDGVIHFQQQTIPDQLSNYLSGLASSFQVQSIRSDQVNTKLWLLKKPLEKAGTKSSFTTETVGTPKDYQRWFSLIRLWTPWIAPRHGNGKFKTEEPALLCSFLRQDGLHFVLLALSGIEDEENTFRDDGNGKVLLVSRNDGKDGGTGRIIAAVGKSFESAIAACMHYARDIVSHGEMLSVVLKAEQEALVDSDDRKALWMENWYDGLTYCTWNGLGQNLSEEKIYRALDSLRDHNIKITNLIIDDNWQSLDNPGAKQDKRGWTRFEANEEGFPKGLRHTITTIREAHPGIQHIAVWHAILGYWGGISPNGELAKNYKTREVSRDSLRQLPGGSLLLIEGEEAPRLYNDFYKFLSESGVDSVKTDAQFFLDLISGAKDRRDFIKPYQDAWTINSLRYFSVKAISCMSQVPSIIFHSQLPTNKPRQMVRNSDDFFPEIPASHPWHIFTNSFASLLTCHLNALRKLTWSSS